jgi:hypothetical protein
MEPRLTAQYDNYPENGETVDNQYRTFARLELAMLVNHATAKTVCKTADWKSGIGGAVGLGDASEATGAIPGTSIGSPAHPAGTHTNGRDWDLGYYQALGSPDNHLRPVCPHTEEGVDQNHCTEPPTTLDAWRTAYLIGTLLESARVRAIGVDGKVGPVIASAMTELCAQGWIDKAACGDERFVYEETDQGLGWYYFHHHHLHVSVQPTAAAVRSLGIKPRMRDDH